MIRLVYRLFVVSFYAAISFNHLSFCLAQKSAGGWKAGVARVIITPQESMWMAGYSSRNHPSEGTLHDIWAKALLLEDAAGKRALLITTDLGGMRKYYTDQLRKKLEEKYHLSKDQVIINFSHTHSGPVVEGGPEDTPRKARESGTGQYSQSEQEKIRKYSAWLQGEIVKLAGDAIKSLGPAQLNCGSGVARFAVNRRNNIEAVTRDGSVQLSGPVDHSVPVLKVTRPNGQIAAVVFGYACHNTVLDIYRWSGDYAGFAQIELEKLHPEVTAMFFQGAGADQNPLPRRTVTLAQQYGTTLASAVERVLQEPMQELESGIVSEYSEINLSFKASPVDPNKKDSGYFSYPYPVQLWRIGNQAIVALGGEVLVDYALKLKQILGKDLIVMGYCNSAMGYIPSIRVLREGGYEGTRVHVYHGDNELPSIWESTIETSILREVITLAENAGIQFP